jgi:hypothetical protein
MKIIISENQVDKIKSKIHEYVKKYGFEKCKEIFGDKVLFTIGFNSNPMEFLNMYNDLDITQSAEKKDWTLFYYEKGKNLMIYNRENDEVYISSQQIWWVLQNHFNLTYTETKQLTREWVSVVYDLRDVTTKPVWSESMIWV